MEIGRGLSTNKDLREKSPRVMERDTQRLITQPSSKWAGRVDKAEEA